MKLRAIWAVVGVLLLVGTARGLITGMVGNTPVRDQQWPAGTLELANLPIRLGCWEGPPFGGGETHFLYRGDTAAFQQALDLLGKINAPDLRLVVNEGPEESFWLKTAGKTDVDPRVDWTFVVWTPRSWMQLYGNPNVTFLSNRAGNEEMRERLPPPTLIVNVAGADGKGIDWTKIKVPAGVTVRDDRATTAGYAREDGSVVRGTVYDMVTSKPLGDATVTVAKLKEQNTYETVAEAKGDAQGHFELKHVPTGSFRVSVVAEGHVSRLVGYETFGPNTLKQYAVQLLTPMAVRGAVKSTDGKALAGVTIIPDGVLGVDGRPYGLIEPTETKTNDQGQFELKGLPEGYFQIMTRREGYERVDSMKIWGGMVSRIASMDNGATSIAITMTAAGKLKGKVVKADGTPDGKANVHVNPPGTTAQRVGHWGGSMQVKEDGSFEFNSVPPGKYVLSADVVRSLEGNDPDAVEAEVKSGETAEVTVKSKGK